MMDEKMKSLSLFHDDKENVPGFPFPTSETATPKTSLDMSPAPVPLKTKHPLSHLVVEVEGNLASGKSTLLKNLQKVVNEARGEEDFCSVFGEIINDDFLKAFYGAPKEYGFAFQMYMLTTRLYQIEESARQAKSEGKVAFLDRGAVGDTLFALLSNKLGNMSDKDMDIYRSVCRQRMPSTLADKVDVCMYLDVDPHECHRRVTTVRNTEAEEGLPLAYLDSVDNCYFHLLMDWIGNRKGGYHEMNIGPPPKMVVIRWDAFGETQTAIDALTQCVENQIRAPTVEFTDKYDAETKISYDTQEHIETGFANIKTLSTEIQKPADRALQEVETVVFNWSLEHNNSFRRLVMFYMSKGCHVIFYNDDLHFYK